MIKRAMKATDNRLIETKADGLINMQLPDELVFDIANWRLQIYINNIPLILFKVIADIFYNNFMFFLTKKTKYSNIRPV